MSDPRWKEMVDLSEVCFTRFHPGDDLFAKIKETAAELGWERVVILSGIGSLENVAFVAPKPAFSIPVQPAENLNMIKMQGPFELMSVEGNIVPLVGEFGPMKDGDPVLHIHCLLSHVDGQLTGGHMVSAQVFTTTEIFLAKVKNSKVKKTKSPVTGLTEMRNDL